MKRIAEICIVVVLFSFEALVHYSIGRTGKFGIILPCFKELLNIILVVLLFSLISAGATYLLMEVE